MKKEEPLIEPVLVCCPTSASKRYCVKEWLEWLVGVDGLTYPNFKIVVFDNSDDGGIYTSFCNKYFKNKYGQDNDQFTSIYIKTKSKNVFERMTHSCEAMRQYALQKGFKKILLLESDIFCEKTVIEDLMACCFPVVGSLFDRDEGAARRLMIQKIIKEAPDSLWSENFFTGEEIGFVDGTVKKVSSVGLGCVLIDKSVLERFEFAFTSNSAPDKHFSEAMFDMGQNVYACTSSMATDHINKEWVFNVSGFGK